MPSPAHPTRRVQIAVGESFGGKHIADDDDRGAGDVCGVHLAREVGKRAPQHLLLRPAGERHYRAGCFGPIAAGQQLRHDRVNLRGGKVQHQRGARRGQRL